MQTRRPASSCREDDFKGASFLTIAKRCRFIVSFCMADAQVKIIFGERAPAAKR